MEKLYNKIDFVNNTTPALNATNLNRMSKGLDDLDNRVIDLAADIMEVGPAAEAAVEAAGTAAEAAETASGASETATGAATSAEGYASDAKNWAVGPSGSGTGTDTNNAKYWAEQAAGAVSGVSSFNGRTGVVLPQNGDYTASDVGAIASTDKGSNGGVAELDNSGKVPISQLPAMGGASSGATGTAGLVPAPAIGDESKVLSGAGVWVPQSSGGAAISCIGYEETGSTCSNPNGYQIGDNFYKDGKFCTAIATINQGATFTENTNYVKGTIADAIKSLNSGLTVEEMTNQVTFHTTNYLNRTHIYKIGSIIICNYQLAVTNTLNADCFTVPVSIAPKDNIYSNALVQDNNTGESIGNCLIVAMPDNWGRTFKYFSKLDGPAVGNIVWVLT